MIVNQQTEMVNAILSYGEILEFWFSERVKKLWFNSNPEFDQEIREYCQPTYVAAMQGKLEDWQNTPMGSLALVIVFDQLPLNMFRKQARSFASEAYARQVADLAIQQGFDQVLTDEQKPFLYMPFMHSEDLDDQNKSVSLYEKANLKANIRFAHHHREIVRRFGRFPHRNSILGRESTPEEIVYLASKEAFHG